MNFYQQDNARKKAAFEEAVSEDFSACDFNSSSLAPRVSEPETECYIVKLELTVDASLFDDSAQVELWVESQLSKDLDIASANAVNARVF